MDLVFDQWAEIRVEIDLDADLYSAFYNDIPIVEDQNWSDGGVSANLPGNL